MACALISHGLVPSAAMLEWTRELTRLRPNGLLKRARWALVHAEARAWENYFKTRTRRPRKAARHEVEGAMPYEPLPWMILRRAMYALAPGPDDVVLDYGSGLGRVLLMAARRPLKRVIGVEAVPQLAQRARANLAKAQRRLQSPVELVVADAAKWTVPDDVTVIVLFNPFVGRIMETVQARIRASLSRHPRPLRVLYAHPRSQPDPFASCEWLRPQRRISTGVYEKLEVTVYEHASWGQGAHARQAEAVAHG